MVYDIGLGFIYDRRNSLAKLTKQLAAVNPIFLLAASAALLSYVYGKHK